MKVVFRADASMLIGTGHVMRCLTLADSLRERGARCSFVCREHQGHLLEVIRERGHAVHILSLADLCIADGREVLPGYADWLGADWLSDAKQTLEIIQRASVGWLVVDHYSLDARWEKLVGAHCDKLLVIDDLADRPHCCDLLLDQNLNRRPDDYNQICAGEPRLLVGPGYALLRPDFAKLRNYSFARRSEGLLSSILISMGGIDKDNATGKVLNALMSVNLPHACKITVVLSSLAPWLAQVRSLASRMSSVEVLVDVQNMAHLIAESDLAIGAAGTSAWERCCLGLPTLTMVIADNQVGVASSLSKIGAVSILEGENLLQELCAKMEQLLVAQNIQRMQEACRSVCDGMGTSRVVEVMSNGN